MIDWRFIYAEIRRRIGDKPFETWLAPTRPIGYEDEILTISVPDVNHRKVLKRSYEQVILSVLKEQGFVPMQVEYVYEQKSPKTLFWEGSEDNILAGVSHDTLNADLSFDTFIVDDSNRFPYQVCLEVSSLKDHQLSPLLLYSNGGFGKTHLLQAIGNFAVRHFPDKSSCYTGAAEFANTLQNCLKWNCLDRFRSYFHGLDLILMDDVHQLAPFHRAQDEFVSLFNTLYDLQKQIVVSSQELPKNITGLEDRLRSRLSWGLIAEISSPSVDLKERLALRKCSDLGISLNAEIVHYLARQAHLDAVGLEKCLIRMAAYMSVQKEAMDLEQAKNLVSGDAKRRKTDKPKSIKETVAEFFNLSVRDLDSSQKNRSVAFARQVAMYLMRTISGFPYSRIAFHFGGKNHSTAVRGCKKIEGLIQTDRKVQKIINDLNMILRS